MFESLLSALQHRVVSFVAPPECAACDESLARDAVFCRACVGTLLPPPSLPEGTTASFAYGGALADAIRSVKYSGRVDRLRALERAVIEGLPSPEDIDVVAPIPLHVSRLRSRGFDQAGVLARAVARALSRPLDVELLARTVDTGHLAALDAGARRMAIHSAFTARRARRVLLVDDVRTTGATLEEASRAIEAVGGSARAHVLAATPRDGSA